MRSIRLSLLVYFSALLALALTVASLLVYRNAQQTLEAKQQVMEQLIQAQYRERCQKEEARLDADLLAEARSLARLVQVQFEGYREQLIQSLLVLGALSNNLSPNGHVLACTWLPEGVPSGWPEPPNPLYLEVRRCLIPNLKPGIRLKLDDLGLTDIQISDYFQIDSPPGESWYSHSMDGRTFPLDILVFAQDDVVDWKFDDYMLGGDTSVRRVVFRASGVAREFPRSGSRRPRESPPSPQRSPGSGSNTYPPRRSPNRGPTIYVHCAASTERRDAALAAFAQQRDEELQELAVRSSALLGDLRQRLWSISLAVIATTIVGGFFLVRLGLSPLQRVTDAVSRISTRDFRLPLDERPLPTELRPIVERLSGTLDLVKRAFAREKQAAADISHELRTPLAALLTTTEFALRKPRSPEQYRELLNDCHTSAQQMHQIVDRLLTLARLDAGVDRLRLQAVDVASLAQQCAAVVRPLVEARGLKLSVKSPVSASTAATTGADGASACVIQVDPDKLREIITNLLHNAIEYNRPGGSIDLSVARENGTLEVDVHDTGIGIAPEIRERIFERFYRADPSRGGDDMHAGLGLAIVKEYIDLMGGSIDVESTEGQGSTFRILLPVRSS